MTDTVPPSPAARWRPFVAAFAAAVVVHTAIVLWMPTFPDRDAWFHSRYAALLLSGDAPWHGLHFPWTTESAFSDFPTDWALGWHWWIAPLTLIGDLVVALKVGVVLQAALLTGVFHALVVRRQVAWPWAWTALLTLGCAGWTFRTHMGRPTPLVVAILLLLFAAIVERRRVAACAAAAAALLVYQVPVPPVLVTLCALGGLGVVSRTLPWRTALAVLGGGVIGVVLHPGFWSVGPGGYLSLDRATFHLWELMRDSIAFAERGGELILPEATMRLPLPLELAAPTWDTIVREFPVPLAATLLGVLAACSRTLLGRRGVPDSLPDSTGSPTLPETPHRRDPWSLGLALFAVVGFVSTWRSGRFLEYWHPFALLAAASWLTPLPASAAGVARPPSRLRVRITLGVLGVLLATQLPLLRQWVRTDADDHGRELRAAAESLDGVAAPGDIVWHGFWDEFAPLFHWNPRVRWITGMDPWYLVAHDRGAPLLMARIVSADFEHDADLRRALTERFGARFVLLWRRNPYQALEARLAGVPWATVVHDDPDAIVFRID